VGAGVGGGEKDIWPGFTECCFPCLPTRLPATSQNRKPLPQIGPEPRTQHPHPNLNGTVRAECAEVGEEPGPKRRRFAVRE
jgi:hypothetical protein